MVGIRALFVQWAGHPQTTSHCLFKGPCWPKTRTPSFWVKISEKYHAFSKERRWCLKCVAALLLCQCLHGVIMFGRHMEAIVFIYHPLTEMFIYHPRLILFSALTPRWHSIFIRILLKRKINRNINLKTLFIAFNRQSPSFDRKGLEELLTVDFSERPYVCPKKNFPSEYLDFSEPPYVCPKKTFLLNFWVSQGHHMCVYSGITFKYDDSSYA